MTTTRIKAQGAPTSETQSTTLLTDVDLQETLRSLLAGCAHKDPALIIQALTTLGNQDARRELEQKGEDSLSVLHETIWALRAEFDPAAVTMSSTNIPDAIVKLSSVLSDTSEACDKVFQLIENQQKIIKQGERFLSELEIVAKQPHVAPAALEAFITRYRAINNAMLSVSNDIVITQEFQDLCGQKVKKVVKLLCDTECYLRELFKQFKVPLPSAKSAAQEREDAAIDQASADSLLKELGL